MMEAVPESYFDDKFELMDRGHQSLGEWQLCYEQQLALLATHLRPGHVVLDVGCGLGLPLILPDGAELVGLEPSFPSIRANRQATLRVNGTALAIPMADCSVDAIVCFYSIHHMVAENRNKTRALVERVFAEFARVLKSGGSIFVFEMTPVAVFALAQRCLWDWAKKSKPDKLDMYFWSAASLAEIGSSRLPDGAHLEQIDFRSSLFTMVRPIFSLPWLKLPRCFHPLRARLYRWCLTDRA
jgi:SAM-dependent methyltransferase